MMVVECGEWCRGDVGVYCGWVLCEAVCVEGDGVGAMPWGMMR